MALSNGTLRVVSTRVEGGVTAVKRRVGFFVPSWRRTFAWVAMGEERRSECRVRRCEQRGERRRRVAGGANAMRIMSVSVSVECGHARGVKRAHVGLEPGGRVQDRLKN